MKYTGGKSTTPLRHSLIPSRFSLLYSFFVLCLTCSLSFLALSVPLRLILSYCLWQPAAMRKGGGASYSTCDPWAPFVCVQLYLLYISSFVRCVSPLCVCVGVYSSIMALFTCPGGLRLTLIFGSWKSFAEKSQAWGDNSERPAAHPVTPPTLTLASSLQQSLKARQHYLYSPPPSREKKHTSERWLLMFIVGLVCVFIQV